MSAGARLAMPLAPRPDRKKEQNAKTAFRSAFAPPPPELIKRGALTYPRHPEDHYVEERWVSRRLFEVERFDGMVLDPACGLGNVVASARARGLAAWGTDIAGRAEGFVAGIDFLDPDSFAAHRRLGLRRLNVVSNPPFKALRAFVEKALAVADGRIAMLMPTRRLNAAGAWLRDTPLARVWFVSPRPAMLPGPVYAYALAHGLKLGTGREDVCWLVFEPGFSGAPASGWLRRDGGRS